MSTRLSGAFRAACWLGLSLVGCNSLLGIEERPLLELGGGSAGSSHAGSNAAGSAGKPASDAGASSGGSGAGSGGTRGDAGGEATPEAGQGGELNQAGTAGAAGTGGTAGSGGLANACPEAINAASSGVHTHSVMVPAADIAAGVSHTYSTSVTEGHMHFVSFTQANYAELRVGGEVKKKTCDNVDHEFVFKCGGGATVPSAPVCDDECGAAFGFTCD